MITIETKTQDAVLTVIEDLALPKVELASNSVNASSGWGVKSLLPYPDQSNLSEISKIKMTSSSRTNSNTDLKNSMRLLAALPYEEMNCQSTNGTLTGKHTIIGVMLWSKMKSDDHNRLKKKIQKPKQ